MVSAIIPNFVKSAKEIEFSFYTPSQSKAKKLAEQVGGEFLAKLPNDLSKYDFVLLGFKPQQFSELAKTLLPMISRNTHIISILAGTKLQTICEQLNVSKVTRIMPNTPAQLGLGASLVSFSATVNDSEKEMMMRMVNSIGVATACTEPELETATPFSGSGPAYFFLLTELLTKDLIGRGFSEKEAEKLCRQTFIGSAKLLQESGLKADQLRANVTSKGGVTHAAVETLKEMGLEQHIHQAINNAIQRNEELGK